jgi:hypothetical protein
MRAGFCAAQAVELARQAVQVVDAGRHPGVNFGSGLLHLSDGLRVPSGALWLPWGVSAAGLAWLAWGGPRARRGLPAWGLGQVTLWAGGGWEVNAPERVALWAACALWLGLAGEDPRAPGREDPWPRRFVRVWLVGMYGMAGMMKLHEPGWWDGTIVAQALVDPWMGGSAAGAWMASQGSLCAALGRLVVAFELFAPVALLVPRWNPWALAAGVAFHLGVGAFLSVGTLGWTVLACYPVALSPTAWAALRARGTA